MKITEEIIPLIEKALGFKLFPWQIDFLANDIPFPDICPCLIKDFDTERIREMCIARYTGRNRCEYRNRRTGETTAEIIKIILSERGRPVELRGSRSWYRHTFIDIHRKLKSVGLPVRELIL